MPLLINQALHVLAAFGVFAALGAICLGGSDVHRKAASILHGVSLVLLLLIGFALLKKPPMGEYWWIAKLVIWLVLGAAPALARRKVLPPGVLLGICFALGAFAALLGLAKSAIF